MLLADFGYDIYADIYLATEETIAKQADVLVRFLRAERQGWTWDESHIDSGATLFEKYFSANGLASDQQILENKTQMKLMVTPYTEAHGLFSMSPADIDKNVSTLQVAGISASPSLFDTSILSML